MLTKEESEYLRNFNTDTNQDEIDNINELVKVWVENEND